MTKREKLIKESNADIERYLLDSKVDAAILGYAERGGPGRYVMPCYGYQAIKAVLKQLGFGGAALYMELRKILNFNKAYELPLILTKYNKRELWKKATECKFTRWEGLDYAVLGVGSIGYTLTGLIYSKPGCIEILEDTSSGLSTDDNGTSNMIYAIKKFDEDILPVYTGEYTPWYLTPVK